MKFIIGHAPNNVEKMLKQWLESNRCARCGVVTIPDEEIWCKECRPDREVVK